ncbi:hypothetical protein ZWY2020_027850 [Hordeum vulgare]|nr:hypothetical protein ZWY2020_027850 [Hordeum vulgare]
MFFLRGWSAVVDSVNAARFQSTVVVHRAFIGLELINVGPADCCSCWLPLLAKHTEASVADEPLVGPLDCEWIWHCHRLNPDCKRLYGRILGTNNVKSSIQANSKDQAEKVWTELYPGEPFELEYSSPSDDFVYVGDGTAGGISYDLISAVRRQSSFVYQVGTPNMHDHRFLEEALARYKGNEPLSCASVDVDLMWHTTNWSVIYYGDILNLLGRVLEASTRFSGTTEQFENTFGLRYWKVGAMYRGSLPCPVTSIPQIFSSEDDGVFGVDKAEVRYFHENRKSIGAGFQCEPTGELILTAMVDQAYFGASSSKKSEPLGRWFELKSHGAYAGSPPVSLSVAASCTVLSQAPQVLSMVNVKPLLSLKAFLLPHSIKDQNMIFWTRFVYDCGTELVRLQIREHKAKSGMALSRELVGVTKSSKQPFQLAEFTKNNWSFNNSNLSITHDLKPSKDGCIQELKSDNKLHMNSNAAVSMLMILTAVTAVKFSTEHPYGKTVALLDTESGIYHSTIGVKLIEGAMVHKRETVEPDTTVASEMVKGGAKQIVVGEAMSVVTMSYKKGHHRAVGVVAERENGHISCGGSMVIKLPGERHQVRWITVQVVVVEAVAAWS